MRNRLVIYSIIVLLFICTIFLSFTYGPANRRYNTANVDIRIRKAAEIEQIWRSTRIHGRILVIFARHLEPAFSQGGFPETDYLEQNLLKGVIRSVFYVVPDGSWSQVVTENLYQKAQIVPPRTTAEGFRLLHIGGQINSLPLSRYNAEHGEKAVIIIDMKSWSPAELLRIERLLKSGMLTSDQIITIE